MSVYLGADPEFVIVSPKGNVQSPIRYKIPSKRDKAVLGNYGSVFRDGFAVEVNLSGAKICRALLIESIKQVIRDTRTTFLREGHWIDTRPAFDIGPKALREAPEDMRQFGCDPDYNAYTGEVNPSVPLDGNVARRRFAGGHMHFSSFCGSSPLLEDPTKYPNIVKWLDLYVGVPLAVIYQQPDEFERRRFYGRAGSFRPQVYPNGYMGLEYRVPSPRLFNHQAIIALFYGIAREVIERVACQPFPERLVEDVRVAIDEGTGAEKVLQVTPEYRSARGYGTSIGYNKPDTILALSQCSTVHTFMLLDNDRDAHYSWPEYAQNEWGIHL